MSLQYAGDAITHCEREISMLNTINRKKLSRKRQARLDRKLNEKKELLAISYYDMAREYEHIGDPDMALEAYDRSLRALEFQEPRNETLYHRISKAKTLALQKRLKKNKKRINSREPNKFTN